MSVKSKLRARKAAALASAKARKQKGGGVESATQQDICAGPKKTGRPPIDFKLQEAARGRSAEALAVAVDIMLNSVDEPTRLQAVKIILERGYGKPTQPIVSANVTPAPESILTAEQAAQLYQRMMGDTAIDLSGITWPQPSAVADPSVVADVPAAPAIGLNTGDSEPPAESNVIPLRGPR
jgi:hypothetical protein